MATKTPSTRSRSTGTRSVPRKRASGGTTRTAATKALTTEAANAVKSIRTRATRAARNVPTDRTTLSIAAGVLAGFAAAGVAIFLNRDKLRDVAASGGEKLKKAADDLSSMAHERIDQARDNITKFRARATDATNQAADDSVAITG